MPLPSVAHAQPAPVDRAQRETTAPPDANALPDANAPPDANARPDANTQRETTAPADASAQPEQLPSNPVAAAPPVPALRAPEPASACDAIEFSREVLMGDLTTQVCPKPIDVTLERLRARLERASAKDTQASFAVLRELRDHCAASAQRASNASWRANLAQQIERVFEQAKQQKRVAASFAAARGPTESVDPDVCLFVTADVDEPNYACFILSGSARPVPTPGSQAIRTFELSGFADAYLAYRTLGVAYAAVMKLDVASLDRAIARLSLARQRWRNLRRYGYLQYPWELAASTTLATYRNYAACFAQDKYCTGEEGLDPEPVRLIVLHPGVGMGFSGFGWKQKPSADAALSISLEAIGASFYGDSFESYLGASIGVVVNDGDFRDVRPGAFLHLTRWLHVGYLLSLFRDSTRYDATLFLSTDLGSALGMDFLEL